MFKPIPAYFTQPAAPLAYVAEKHHVNDGLTKLEQAAITIFAHNHNMQPQQAVKQAITILEEVDRLRKQAVEEASK